MPQPQIVVNPPRDATKSAMTYIYIYLGRKKTGCFRLEFIISKGHANHQSSSKQPSSSGDMTVFLGENKSMGLLKWLKVRNQPLMEIDGKKNLPVQS